MTRWPRGTKSMRVVYHFIMVIWGNILHANLRRHPHQNTFVYMLVPSKERANRHLFISSIGSVRSEVNRKSWGMDFVNENNVVNATICAQSRWMIRAYGLTHTIRPTPCVLYICNQWNKKEHCLRTRTLLARTTSRCYTKKDQHILIWLSALVFSDAIIVCIYSSTARCCGCCLPIVTMCLLYCAPLSAQNPHNAPQLGQLTSSTPCLIKTFEPI